MEPSDKMKDLISKADSVLKNIIPELGTLGLKFFDESFERKGFKDVTEIMWERRKLNINDEDKDPHPLLEKSGALRESVRVLSKDENSITLGSTLPYASVQNDGNKSRNIPAREFMGKSEDLQKKIEELVLKELNAIWS